MEKALVSVLIPAYNHENFVQETINSIINQTYSNIELLIIDDGSQDSTWEKILDMQPQCKQRFVNTYFLTQKNSGTCITLNKMLKIAKGEYLYIIASDDIAKPQAIEKEINFLSQNPDYSLVVGNNEFIDNNSKVCYWDRNKNTVYNKDKATYLTFADFLKENKLFNFSSDEFGTYHTLYTSNYIPNGYLIRKAIYEQIEPFTPDAPLEDWFLMLQISKYSKMKYIDEVLFSYRWHDSNTIKNKEKVRFLLKKTREYEEYILQHLEKSKVKKDVIEIIEKENMS